MEKVKALSTVNTMHPLHTTQIMHLKSVQKEAIFHLAFKDLLSVKKTLTSSILTSNLLLRN